MTSKYSLELHIVTLGNVDVVFHPPSLTFFKVNRKTATVLKSYVEGRPIDDCAAMHGCTAEDIESLLRKLQEEIEGQVSRCPITMYYETGFLSGRLNLLVSQDCNLRCRYCNAGGGDYGKKRGLMSREVAIQTLDAFTGNEFYFESIQFFGGEPSLNVPAIRAVCEHLAEMAREGRISRLPAMGIVTNGFHISDELFSLINEYDIGVTVSLDGPPEVNDLQRVDAGGRGTYKRVAHSIRRLQRATNGRKPEMIEATITKNHYELGITYDDLIIFFVTELGVERAHIAVLEGGYDDYGTLSDEERLSWDIAAHVSMIDNLAKGDPRVSNIGFRVLRKLIFKKINPYVCPVGVSSLTVDLDGEIYPCYQLMDAAFYMGNVFEADVLPADRFKIEKAMRANSKYEHKQCRTCWARGVCTGCLGEIYALTGSPYARVDTLCTRIKKCLEVVLCGLAELRTDKTLWPQIVERLGQETRLVDGPGLC